MGVKLTFQQIDLRLAHPWAVSRSPASSLARVVLVRMVDANGVEGVGEAAPIARYGETPESVGEFLGRLDPARLSFFDWQESWNYTAHAAPANWAAKSAVAGALIDGAGKRLGLAVYDLLGLGFQEGAHSTSFTLGIDEPEVIRRKALAADAYPVLKLKVGVPADAANLAAVREVAPAKPLRIDANEAWVGREEALAHIQRWAEDGHVQWVEQPMPATARLEDWRWLKERSPLPIYADESCRTLADMSAVAEGFHGVNVKLAKAGGVVAAWKMLRQARELGLQTMIGCMIETSVGISAAAHLASLADHLDLDGNLLITNDPYEGVGWVGGRLTFAGARQPHGLRVSLRP